ncbi:MULTISPECIES: VOC family protein [unclassified Rathayibacter]|uniref:VOC family protein n=1 Tax=unclassified Rathayibacter TaxID=2609250 RepID=UPI0006F6E44E|nr:MULTISPECIES: VOC family protein [unclassified Rathayibacter]KQQ05066.1 3-demethylubiquinone-9 3-methyltransferase [Rathayibacter sp. Leaf294]KQS12929.1 3-demethylubiquinone-9 3-methyltransferase [Rathayibacter sp. Leaf185]
MSTSLSPYISFRGTAREAMEYYRSVFGGELQSSTFADFPMGGDPADDDLIMHAQLTTPKGLILMGSDTPSSMDYDDGARVTIAVFGDDAEEAGGYFDALADGGSVTMPLSDSPWGDRFGMLVDRYGVGWMINISGPSA